MKPWTESIVKPVIKRDITMEHFECFYCFQEFNIIEKQTWNDEIENDCCKLCMEWFDSKQRNIRAKLEQICLQD